MMIFDPFEVGKSLSKAFQFELPFAIKNKQIYKVDNGYVLDFDYRSGDKFIKTKRVYLTEGELETGIQALEMEFDNLLRKE